MLGWLLFGKGHRHLTAEILHKEATRGGLSVSLTTIYNTLRRFATVGLVREHRLAGQMTYFDTNLDQHQHFLLDGEHLVDASSEWIGQPSVVVIPEGYEVERVDVVVRLRRRGIGAASAPLN